MNSLELWDLLFQPVWGCLRFLGSCPVYYELSTWFPRPIDWSTKLSSSCMSTLLTNYMELSPSWESDSFSATQEIINIIWTWKFITVLTISPPSCPYHEIDGSSLHPYPVSLRSILILSSIWGDAWLIYGFRTDDGCTLMHLVLHFTNEYMRRYVFSSSSQETPGS
jgi:hypothetical protein